MDAQEYAAQLDDLEKKLDRLRALYEQYFMGIERIEPAVPRKVVDRKFVELRKVRVRNTALRFRFQTLVQRHTTLFTYWGRVCRQIEEGTFQRDILRARRGERLEGADEGRVSSASSAGDLAIDVVLDGPDDPAGLDGEEGAGGEAPPPGRLPSVPPPPGVARVRSLDALRAALDADDPDDLLAPPRARSLADLRAALDADDPDDLLAPPRARSLADLRAALDADEFDGLLAGARPGAAGAGRRADPATAAAPPPAPRPRPAAPAPPRPVAPAAGAKPAVAGAGVVANDRLRVVHDAYAEARRAAGLAGPGPSPEALRKTLEKEAARMRGRHPGKEVDFRVEIKDGKPVIKSFVK